MDGWGGKERSEEGRSVRLCICSCWFWGIPLLCTSAACVSYYLCYFSAFIVYWYNGLDLWHFKPTRCVPWNKVPPCLKIILALLSSSMAHFMSVLRALVTLWHRAGLLQARMPLYHATKSVKLLKSLGQILYQIAAVCRCVFIISLAV